MSDELVRALERRALAGDRDAIRALAAWARRAEPDVSSVLKALLEIAGRRAEREFPDGRRDMRDSFARASSPNDAVFWGRVWVSLLVMVDVLAGTQENEIRRAYGDELLSSGGGVEPALVSRGSVESIEAALFG